MKNYDEIRNHFYGTLGFIQLLQMKITELSEGYCKGEMPLRPEILNPLGTVHGGCTFALADTIGGSAALTHGDSIVTVDSNIHYLAPACDTEKLVAEAKEIKYGSTIAVYEVNVYKADGTMVATFLFYHICQKQKRVVSCPLCFDADLLIKIPLIDDADRLALASRDRLGFDHLHIHLDAEHRL